jgi:hypothetical protein
MITRSRAIGFRVVVVVEVGVVIEVDCIALSLMHKKLGLEKIESFEKR